MTTVRELRKDVDELKIVCSVGDSETLQHYRDLAKTLVEYSRLSDVTPEKEKREAIEDVLKDYSKKRGRFSDIPTKK